VHQIDFGWGLSQASLEELTGGFKAAALKEKEDRMGTSVGLI